MYQGKAIGVKYLQLGLVELVLDIEGSPANVLNDLMLRELREAVELLESDTSVTGLLISSAKKDFILGADVTEFNHNFSLPAEELKIILQQTHDTFSRLENLPYPVAVAINGFALGGGFELALAADYRVMAADAKVGLPEVNLGICPGWGGTVRLSRLIGAKSSLSWMLTGKLQHAQAALKCGAVDCVAQVGDIRSEALRLLESVASGKSNYLENRLRKLKSVSSGFYVSAGLDSHFEEEFKRLLNPNYPAASKMVTAVSNHIALAFNDALAVETDTLISLAKSDASKNLIKLFINDQALKKRSKSWSKKATKIEKSAVLGAGIMGGGIAHQSASSGTPILMKDIHQEALDLGLATASKLLDKKIEKGRLDDAGKIAVLGGINSTLDYSGFSDVEMVIEAVVENPDVKTAVLADVENAVADHAVLASNTSTISIDYLAKDLERPERFCGMHFFNPVHLMPLVEVIRGKKTNEQTIAQTVAYATSMGKTPIVVNDCPGFLVNRILFPYLNAFNRLMIDGVDFQRIDRVMENFGWPMGPAYLSDVVGIDTLVHADHVMEEGFPDRMKHAPKVISEELLHANYLGQKNSKGYYEYGVDKNGRNFKEPSGLARQLMTDCISKDSDITDQDIIDRMMIPMCMEAVRCLEDGIVETAAEVDMGLILGIGFPRFRGGALAYIDTLGLDVFAAKVEANSQHGPLYQLTDGFKAKLAKRSSFH